MSALESALPAESKFLHTGHSPISEEEFPMTMQVGMVGTDGVILASDTKWTDTRELRHTFGSSKIKLTADRRVAITCARNMETSCRMAEWILAELSDEQRKNPIAPIRACFINRC